MLIPTKKTFNQEMSLKEAKPPTLIAIKPNLRCILKGEVTTFDPCGVCVRGDSPGRSLDGRPRQCTPGPVSLMEAAIRCTASNCACDCFSPSKESLRSCDNCKHGWVVHAVAKLGGGFRRLLGGSPETGPAYDVAALILYGAQALPIRLKILLDRLLGALRHEEVLGLLAAFGWTYEDYVRGYIAQGPAGQVLDRWSLVGRDEEPVILQEFLRFGETKTIAHQLLGGEAPPAPSPSPPPLHRLQSMQPGDYRVRPSPEPVSKPPAAFSVAHLTAVSDPSATDEDDAINLSQRPDVSSLGALDSVYSARKVRHLRKSANPMKRRCNPHMLSTLATNPSTGKKRVQCQVCYKTFCDKGALKIHFSAVHLREMHKCTVVGCNMMFSSRRSRNRHSANPNPKLHTPNIRRKMNPHDGRTALPYPIFPTPTAGALLNYNNNLLHSSPYLGDIKVDSVSSTTSSTEETPMPFMTSTPTSHNSQGGPDDSKKLRLSSDDGEENGINLSTKPSGVSRRKSFNPTKCAVSSQSDEDLQYISTDDTSSDTCNDFLSKTEEEEDDSELLSNEDSKDEDPDRYSMLSLPMSKSGFLYENCIKEESNFNLCSTKPRDFSVDSLDLSKKSTYLEKKASPPPSSTSQLPPPPPPPPTTSCTEENPIRRLESLSMGSFNNTPASENCSPLALSMPPTFSSSSSSGVSFHAPGLGLGTDVTVTTTALSSALPSSSVNGDCTDLVPFFRDPSGGHSGSMDIPVDRENPRRCTVCGKIFQNHFGVKTHYQNVHLKLMHKCTVEGCNAAFPSKRSRDRHSANLNLHRKLLSTSTSEKLAAHFYDKSSAAAALFAFSPHGPAGRAEELYSRMYDYAAELYHGYMPFGGAGFVGGPPTSPATSSGTTPSPRPAPSLLEDTPTNESGDGCHSCQLCHKKFHEPLVLRDHYEKFHLADLYRCSVEGCARLYLSRKARDACCHPK